MSFISTVSANKKQQEKIFNKHLKHKVFNLSYSYDDEDDIGFVTCYTILGNKCEFQFRRGVPCFVDFHTMSIRYDIAYPEGDLYKRLKEIGDKAAERFWKGGQI